MTGLFWKNPCQYNPSLSAKFEEFLSNFCLKNEETFKNNEYGMLFHSLTEALEDYVKIKNDVSSSVAIKECFEKFLIFRRKAYAVLFGIGFNILNPIDNKCSICRIFDRDKLMDKEFEEIKYYLFNTTNEYFSREFHQMKVLASTKRSGSVCSARKKVDEKNIIE